MHADPDAALDRIVERYHQVAEQCDAVVIVGSDYTDVGTPTEFSYNARIAANLGAPVLLVLNGSGRSPHELRTIDGDGAGRAQGQPRHARSRWSPTGSTGPTAHRGRRRRSTVEGVPAYALPEEPLLSAPSVGDLMPAVRRHACVSGDHALLSREVDRPRGGRR